jgi:HORMA domain-containing protein
MTTATSTTTHTRTNTAVYLTDVILGAIGDILAELGIDTTRLYADWDQDERAIKRWIEEESLKTVVLECRQPNGKVAPIVEFPIVYQPSGVGDAAFTAQRAQLARFRAKLASVPSGTIFGLICTYRAAHTTMPGWGPATRAPTDGLSALNFGTLASAPHASASMRILR